MGQHTLKFLTQCKYFLVRNDHHWSLDLDVGSVEEGSPAFNQIILKEVIKGIQSYHKQVIKKEIPIKINEKSKSLVQDLGKLVFLIAVQTQGENYINAFSALPEADQSLF